ncbi:MAG: pyrroline-5-carboxylate reductase [Myxococcota bacterium]
MDSLGTIGFIGGGTMTEAIVRGLLEANVAAPGELCVGDPRAERRAHLARTYGLRAEANNADVVEASDVLVLAVKPQALDRVLPEVAAGLGPGTLVVSIAAGVPLQALEAALPSGARVVRTMPNTPAQVRAGATALSPGRHATADDIARARRLFESVGIVEVLEEALLDAVTGLSGSGPAFLFVVIEALADGGVKVGLHRSTAQRLAAQTVLGAAQLLIETGEHPGRLKDMVASPGGTTIAGLHTLESGGLRRTLMDAVEDATRRSSEIGAELATRLAGARDDAPGS